MAPLATPKNTVARVADATAAAKPLEKPKGPSAPATTTVSRVASPKGWANEKLKVASTSAIKAFNDVRAKVHAVASDKTAQVTAASAVGGGALVGAGAAATGAAAGGTIGAAVGLVPALFTFGLSIPVCAVVGSGCGLAIGGVAGGTVGGVGAGATGYGAYKKRAEIHDLLSKVRARAAAHSAKLASAMTVLKTTAAAKLALARDVACKRTASARTQVAALAAAAKRNVSYAAKATKAKAQKIVSEKSVQVSAASAVGGAAVLGAGGAAAGVATGGAMGFLTGVVLAPFTLGLSIPVATTVGGGFGFVSGAAVGSAAGGVSGGAVGYGAYVKRQAIGGAASATLKKVDSFSKTMKSSATESAQYVRARLMGGTGGSA